MKKVSAIYPAPAPHWVGDGFPVRSLFSYQQQGQAISPFLLLDHAGPMEFSPAKQKRGVGEHPHRGFETVTLVYKGELAHKDSTGEQGTIGVGDVQWMTAGRGILHEEFHSEAFSQSGGMLEMVQLWVNLPKRDKMTAPGYQTITAKQIPTIELTQQQGRLRLIAGKLADKTGPAKTHSPMLVMDGELNTSAQYQLPLKQGWTGIVIVRSGQLQVNGKAVSAGHTAVLAQDGNGLELSATENSQLLILAGEPLNEPLAGYGPFVMNTQGEIKQAINDFNSGRFGQL